MGRDLLFITDNSICSLRIMGNGLTVKLAAGGNYLDQTLVQIKHISLSFYIFYLKTSFQAEIKKSFKLLKLNILIQKKRNI